MYAGLLACALVAPAVASAQVEETAAQCSNGLDDDGDGAADCADAACGAFVFCAAQPRAVVHSRSLVWMQVTGALLWGVIYVGGVGVTAGVGGTWGDIGLNAIPLAGPWLCFGGLCEDPAPYAAALVSAGIAQALGLALLVAGSAITVEERSIAFAPWVGPELAGAALAGRW